MRRGIYNEPFAKSKCGTQNKPGNTGGENKLFVLNMTWTQSEMVWSLIVSERRVCEEFCGGEESVRQGDERKNGNWSGDDEPCQCLWPTSWL